MTLRFFLIIFFSNLISSQSLIRSQVLSTEQFISAISKNHPVAKQAELLTERAKADLQSSRGNFDPVFDFEAAKKTFGGKDYYYHNNPELKIPTRAGFDIKSGLEYNTGDYINPESTQGQSSYLGIEVPLGKGLVIDKRRAALRQAKIFNGQSQQEKLVVINDLLFDAYSDYWQWAGAHEILKIYAKFLAASNKRLKLVKIAHENGDRSISDTVEAYAQVQNYYLLQTEALIKFNKASYELSNYLWLENDKPYQLHSGIVPDSTQFANADLGINVEEIIKWSYNQNPALQVYDFKLRSLLIEKKLKFQGFLPSLNFQANLLSKDFYEPSNFNQGYLQNNYKWGINFKVPLFLRQARGEYASAQIKIKETTLELLKKQWQTENKIRAYNNENILLQQQLNSIKGIIANYTLLLRNEELKFNQGESSLFLINTREIKVLEILQKQIETRVKNLKAMYSVMWAAGALKF